MRYLLAALALVAIAAAVKVRRVGDEDDDLYRFIPADFDPTRDDIVGMPTLVRDIDWDRFFDNAGRQN